MSRESERRETIEREQIRERAKREIERLSYRGARALSREREERTRERERNVCFYSSHNHITCVKLTVKAYIIIKILFKQKINAVLLKLSVLFIYLFILLLLFLIMMIIR